MDVISKLRDAVNRKDRISFMHFIHDFSDDDIIRLTEQEFEEIIDCCTKINLDGVEEFFDFLFNEGLKALENTEIKKLKENALVCRFYLDIFMVFYLEHNKYFAQAAGKLGIACLRLAEFGMKPKSNLEKSIQFNQEARKILPKNSRVYAHVTVNMGIAHIRLAELGVNPIENLNDAIRLEQKAKKILPKDNLDYACAVANQGVAHLIFAEFGVDTIKNLEESIKLQQQVREIFPENSQGYVLATMNQGNSYAKLAELGIKPEKNFKTAEELYDKSRNVSLSTKDGWSYPLAVLNTYALYRSIFWKNGDKNFLEKAKILFKEATKNVETWDVLRKNEIIGELYAVEADLYELENDYYNAGMKYRDAYGLTKNIFYKFMCEFCRTKLSKKETSFCKLIQNWKLVDKSEIFLDFFNYATFECHLEEAVENEAFRFFEINAAKNKLDEIYVRTHIHHIKTRVGACIDILIAYLNYFPENETNRNEGKAIECITNACRAFNSQGNKPEIELCNLFSKAIKNKDSQEVWIYLIKNNLSNNLSKLIGEAAFIERTKLETRGTKRALIEIKEVIKEIKTNIEEFKSEIRTGFIEIEKSIDVISKDNEVLRTLLIGYANKTQGLLLNLLDESKNCESKTQELIKDFSEDIVKKLDERDDIWLEKLKNELIKKESEIEKELSSAPPEIRSKWHQWIDKIKNKMETEVKEIVRGLPREAVIIVSTEKILEYGIPFLTAAITSPVALPALIAILYALREAIPTENPSVIPR